MDEIAAPETEVIASETEELTPETEEEFTNGRGDDEEDE